MRAIVIDQPGDENVMHLAEVPAPAAGPGELLVRVAATAVNRADLLQRRGLYPPPPGASPLLGLECSGTVAAVGEGVTGFAPGDAVMALLPGGGYAEQVTVAAGCVMPVKGALSLTAAAAVPEVFLTVFLTVFQLGAFREGETVLVHGGGSGVGTALISLVRAAGGTVVVTAGSDEKCRRCEELGAARAVNYRTADFVEEVRAFTGGGADIVLDAVGAPYFQRNLEALATGGRLVLIGSMGGTRTELDIGTLMRTRATVIGSTLRSRPVEEKAALVAAFLARFGAHLADGRVAPVVDRVLPLARAADAHRLMAASGHFGKIVLEVA